MVEGGRGAGEVGEGVSGRDFQIWARLDEVRGSLFPCVVGGADEIALLLQRLAGDLESKNVALGDVTDVDDEGGDDGRVATSHDAVEHAVGAEAAGGGKREVLGEGPEDESGEDCP